MNGDKENLQAKGGTAQENNPRGQPIRHIKRLWNNIIEKDLVDRLNWVYRSTIGSLFTTSMFIVFQYRFKLSSYASWSFALAIGFFVFVLLTALHEIHTNRKLSRQDTNLFLMDKELRAKEENYKAHFQRYLHNISDAVKYAAWGLDVDYHYDVCKFTYIIGEAEQDDSWSRYYKIVAPDEKVVVAKDMKFGARGLTVKGLSSFEDLGIDYEVETGRLAIIPRFDPESKKAWWADIFFIPPLDERETREFRLSGKYSGLWNDARDKGEDAGTILLNKKAKVFEINIIFPASIKNAEITDKTPNKGTLPEPTRTPSGQLGLRWVIQDADPLTYEFKLVCSW